MKRKNRRLALAKETVSNLSPSSLGRAAGGLTTPPLCSPTADDSCINPTQCDNCFTRLAQCTQACTTSQHELCPSHDTNC